MTAKRRSCTALDCEHEKYIVDIFSYVEPGHHGQHEARKQLFLYITRAEGKSRKGFLQVIIEEKKTISHLPMVNLLFALKWNPKRRLRPILASLKLRLCSWRCQSKTDKITTANSGLNKDNDVGIDRMPLSKKTIKDFLVDQSNPPTQYDTVLLFLRMQPYLKMP